jgi:hypothetical protein
MYKNDWNDFINDVSWFTRSNDKVVVSEAVSNHQFFAPSNEFEILFPNLTKLLLKARNTRVEINEETYQLLGWTDTVGDSFGWLCRQPDNRPPVFFCKEHKLLLNYFGGITERWNEKEGSWLLNLNTALTSKESEQGFRGWESYLDDICREEGIETIIDPYEFISFAFEANGNFTLYHKENSSVIMFAPDHCFEHLTPLDGYPEYSIYTINDCPNIITWIETIAKQELKRLVG